MTATKLEECAAEGWRAVRLLPFFGAVATQKEKDAAFTRAVIRCLMEPSDAMLEASWKVTSNRTREEYMEMELATDKKSGHKKKTIRRFRAMLQSVLDEGKE